MLPTATTASDPRAYPLQDLARLVDVADEGHDGVALAIRHLRAATIDRQSGSSAVRLTGGQADGQGAVMQQRSTRNQVKKGATTIGGCTMADAPA